MRTVMQLYALSQSARNAGSIGTSVSEVVARAVIEVSVYLLIMRFGPKEHPRLGSMKRVQFPGGKFV